MVTSAELSSNIELGKFNKPKGILPPQGHEGKIKIWTLPGLIKISPVSSKAMYNDMGVANPANRANAVWDGKQVSLFGIKGEYVDFQICIERLVKNLSGIKVNFYPLKGPGGSTIGGSDIELFFNWYSRTSKGKWQPAYLIPMQHGQSFQIPDQRRGIRNQKNQTIYVDIYIPKNARPGQYAGKIEIEADGINLFVVPVGLKIYDYLMPDELAFWPEMNAYKIPPNVHDYYRLAHQNRCVANFWVFRPRLSGSGRNIKVRWETYDKIVGPLLTGRAFKNNRRAGHPTECLYLPFEDSWPTPLTQKTYFYNGHWPTKGESREHLVQHYLTAPYIGEGLSRDYKDAFLSGQRQFIEHFKKKGWNRTEMQCFYGGKKDHRINYGANMWWTTDEPYHWDDWLALQFFNKLWTMGRKANRASKTVWKTRADISRPQWQGRVLDGITDTVYYGGFNNPITYLRGKILKRDTGIKLMTYGAANAHDRSNTETVALVLSMWLNGADGFLPWQTIGNKHSLDRQESCSGNALFVPGDKFGYNVIGDMRLKAFRKGEQLIEYLLILGRRYHLNREQIKHIVLKSVSLQPGRIEETVLDNADVPPFNILEAWQISELRRTILELIP